MVSTYIELFLFLTQSTLQGCTHSPFHPQFHTLRLPYKVATYPSGTIRRSVSCSRTLQHNLGESEDRISDPSFTGRPLIIISLCCPISSNRDAFAPLTPQIRHFQVLSTTFTKYSCRFLINRHQYCLKAVMENIRKEHTDTFRKLHSFIFLFYIFYLLKRKRQPLHHIRIH